MSDKIKSLWNSRSDEYYRAGTAAETACYDRIAADPSWAFPPEVFAMLTASFPSFADLRVLVPSSGDNCAAFGFHLLGAKVTSADISERQLYNAKRIADSRGWDVDFICADSMKLDGIKSGEYDLVYTSNGVHVWIDDLAGMYGNFRRVLKPHGKYIMFETHPFIRPFDDSAAEIKVIKTYGDTQPHGEDVTYSWRIGDIVNAVIGAGFALNQMEEFHARPDSCDLWFYKTIEEANADGNGMYDWNQNPWAALPQWLALSADVL
jgi:Methylase involved in ubiquinone/menaquinone biosynthesis